MERFNKIIENIQKEVLELKEINNTLQKENAYLKKQLGISVFNSNDILSLEEVFKKFYLEDDFNGQKHRVYSCCIRSGYKNIGDFRDKSIYDLIKLRSAGVGVCSILIVLLEHYDVHIDLPDLKSIRNFDKCSTIEKIYKELPKIRERIIFSK